MKYKNVFINNAFVTVCNADCLVNGMTSAQAESVAEAVKSMLTISPWCGDLNITIEDQDTPCEEFLESLESE